MKLNQLYVPAAGAILGISALALAIRFFGNQPGLSDVKEGLKGNVKQ